MQILTSALKALTSAITIATTPLAPTVAAVETDISWKLTLRMGVAVTILMSARWVQTSAHIIATIPLDPTLVVVKLDTN